VTFRRTHLDLLMTQRGLENHELATQAGTSRQAVWKLRNGYTRMLPDWAKRVAPHLGVTWQELVDGVTTPADQGRAEWIAAYDALDDEQRRALLTVATGMIRRDSPPEPEAPRPRLRAVGCGVVKRDGRK
jgi:hypothetical protein